MALRRVGQESVLDCCITLYPLEFTAFSDVAMLDFTTNQIVVAKDMSNLGYMRGSTQRNEPITR